MKKVGIIGYGKIGREVEKRVLARGWEINKMVNTSGVYRFSEGIRIKFDESSNWLEHFKGVDIGILCISTLDDGMKACEYIKALAGIGVPVVTSEKGSFGNYFLELEPWISKIGYSAVVGGGTRMLHWLRNRLSRGTIEVHAIINGTLNYCLDGWDKGRGRDEVVEEAKKLNYAEPGSQATLEVINKEACGDVPMKVAALLNICNFGAIRAREIDVPRVTEADLKRLVREAALRRYIVSIAKEQNNEEDVIGGFKFKIGEWYVSAGFKNRNENPLFRQLVPPGVNNAVLIYGRGGTYILTGPGAGEFPVVDEAIMKDIENLLEIKE